MKLRNFLRCRIEDFRAGPVWMREFGPETYPVGEVGILEDVHKSTENYCYLVITYNGSRYVGVIQCEIKIFSKNSIVV